MTALKGRTIIDTPTFNKQKEGMSQASGRVVPAVVVFDNGSGLTIGHSICMPGLAGRWARTIYNPAGPGNKKLTSLTKHRPQRDTQKVKRSAGQLHSTCNQLWPNRKNSVTARPHCSLAGFLTFCPASHMFAWLHIECVQQKILRLVCQNCVGKVYVCVYEA